jgi:hypothetical protein
MVRKTSSGSSRESAARFAAAALAFLSARRSVLRRAFRPEM